MKKIILILCLFVMALSCSKDENTAPDTYDRTALLTNWADNIIVPSYTNYQAKVSVLQENTNIFIATPTTANLQLVRTAWLESYKAYQYVMLYNFGKALEIN